MKQVYLVEDLRLANRQCALAEMLDAFADPAMQRKAAMAFHREAEMLATLDNSHIPRVYDNFSEQNRHYLVMEYVDGITLEEKLALSGGGLAEAAVADIGLQAAEALEYLHGLRPPIVYRDLKPSNLIITATGLVKLIDFGIARYFQPLKTATAIGTQGYAAPEQYKGKAEARSDIYALGATMHHLLTGRDPAMEPPFSFPPVEQLRPNCNPALAKLINDALAYRPEDRPASAAEFEQLLLSAKMGAPLPAAAAHPVGQSGLAWRQRAGLYAMAFFGYTAINGSFHAFWHREDPLWLFLFKLAASFLLTLALVEALVSSRRWFRASRSRSESSARFTWLHHAALLALACFGYDLTTFVAFLSGRAKIPVGNPLVFSLILSLLATVAIVEGFLAICRAFQRMGRTAAAPLPAGSGQGATRPSAGAPRITQNSRYPSYRWIMVEAFGVITGALAIALLLMIFSRQRNPAQGPETGTPLPGAKGSPAPVEATPTAGSVGASISAEDLEKRALAKRDDADAWLRAARAWYSQAQTDEYFNLKIAPRHPDAARILPYKDHDKEYRDAARDYEHYFARGGDDQGARLNLAATYVKIDRASKAIPECKRVLAQDPSSFRAALILGNYSEARAALRKAAKLAPDEKAVTVVATLSTDLDQRTAALDAQKIRQRTAAPNSPEKSEGQATAPPPAISRSGQRKMKF